MLLADKFEERFLASIVPGHTAPRMAANLLAVQDADTARAEDVVASPVTSLGAERLLDNVTARLRLALKVKGGEPSFRSDLARQVCFPAGFTISLL